MNLVLYKIAILFVKTEVCSPLYLSHLVPPKHGQQLFGTDLSLTIAARIFHFRRHPNISD